MGSKQKLIEELKALRDSLKLENVKSSTKAKQKIKVDKKGYTDALILSLLTGVVGGIIIGISLMVTNIIS